MQICQSNLMSYMTTLFKNQVQYQFYKKERKYATYDSEQLATYDLDIENFLYIMNRNHSRRLQICRFVDMSKNCSKIKFNMSFTKTKKVATYDRTACNLRRRRREFEPRRGHQCWKSFYQKQT